MRILVAEDDPSLRALLVEGLGESGYIVDSVDNGEDAINQLRWYEYDVAVIDWRMPRRSGIEVVAWARQNHRPTALLMLTARDTPQDRVEGLDTGADDYLVKPFDFDELRARVRALQRRGGARDGAVLVRADVELDPIRHEVRVGGESVRLSITEYRILELLMRRFPGVVDRNAIAQHGWEDETDPIGSNAIDVQVSRLRGKLSRARLRVATVRGVGYRLEEP